MELVVSEFNGEIQKRILDKLNTEYLCTGKYVNDQMSVSPLILSSLMLSGGTAGTLVSASMSSSLFMATANPATLMQSGSGVLSAVVNPVTGKIAEQAAFIPVASSIPVVAPLMAMQALSSVVMLQQFRVMDKKLDTIKGAIDKILARQEATNVAKLFAAVHLVDEIYLQHGQTGCFSSDMLIRLALAERDAMILSRRYEMLENFEDNSTVNGYAYLDNLDTYCTVLASFLNLRVKYLRTCVDIQENPQFVHRSLESFSALVKYDIYLWERMLRKADDMKIEIDKLVEQLNNAKGLKKIARKPKEKELSRKKDNYVAVMEKERIILKDFHTLIDTAKQINEMSDTEVFPTLVYWHDNKGDHCFTTNEQIFDMVMCSEDSKP